MTTRPTTAGSGVETPAFGRFFLPGPTEVRPEVLAAQLRPMIPHRGRAMEELIARIQVGLRHVFRTERPVYISSSSATGLMEGALRSGARRRVLALVNGAFSERFHQIAVSCALDVDRLDVPLGEAFTAGRLEEALRGGDYDTVTVVHSETSTGALTPIADLARVVHDAGDITLLVDSVTGVGGTLVDTDAWGLDFVLTGSQKALALPPGLALGVASERLLERARTKGDRGTYFDLVEFERSIRANQTPNTPALSLFYALDVQLERIAAETVEGRWARHDAMARRTWEWVDAMRDAGVPLSVLSPPGFRSPTVSCITLPAGRRGGEVSGEMERRGYTIAPGYGALKDSTVRIGHMGDHTVGELDALLDELGRVVAG
jgi:aspartate aminotransferase-like enzyme